MSDLRKWLKIMESVPAVFHGQPEPQTLIKRDATVMVSPAVGGGTGRYMHSTPNGAMIDIKGVAKELSEDDFSLPERDYEEPYQKGNDWFHMSQEQDTIGRMNDKPEFRPGDMVKIADVYGSVIGPGFGVFIAYSTNGQECIVSFDDEEMLVPIENIGSVLEQDAKDNFDEMDNDGNLSPMSLAQDNVKIEQPQTGMSRQEPAMDHRDEFSKWMEAVEEAMSTESVALSVPEADANGCGCGLWECPVCFPDNTQTEVPGSVVNGGQEMGGEMDHMCPACGQVHAHGEHTDNDFEVIELESGSGGVGAGAVAMEDDPAIAAFLAKGGQVQELPYKNRPRQAGREFGSKHIGSASGKETSRGALRGGNASVSTKDKISGKPVVGEEDNTMIEKPKSGKGVKLGDIVKSVEYRKSGGQNSPMTYGDDNLDGGMGVNAAAGDGMEENNVDMADPQNTVTQHAARTQDSDIYGKAGKHLQQTFDNGLAETDEEDEEVAFDMISTIKYMQDMGLSNAAQAASPEQLSQMPFEQLKSFHDEVTGSVGEATRPTKTRDPMSFSLDDMDDVLNPRQADLPATIDSPTNDGDVVDAEPMRLPAASRDSTQQRIGAMTPSDTMRDFMSRIDRNAGADDPALPDTPTDALTVRTASDVPAVVSSAMQASGMQTPEWHNVSNLPGFGDRNVRGMGRQVFGMFTSTPVEQIQTMANVEGQGPNTDAEMRAVAGWLRDNTQDLGQVELSHGQAIPGYKPDVKEYSANGVRFHVVRDPMGQYIYAYPDKDARSLAAPAQQGRLQGATPRLRENDAVTIDKPTMFERIKWDEELFSVLKESELDEELLDESSLSKMLGKDKGGQKLVSWLHKKHKLSNEADLQPAPFSERLLWKEFKSNPDNFVIVSAANGVAGVKPYKKFIDDRTADFLKRGKTYNPAGDSTLPYQIIAFTDSGEQIDPAYFRQPTEPGAEPEERHADPTVMRARMGKHAGKDMQNPTNTFNLLADKIGALRTVWVASGAVERGKMDKRADMKKADTINPRDALNKIFKRVRPVLKTLANQALSQINRTAQRYITGGNFEGAQKVAASGQKLKNFLVTLDTAKDITLDSGHNSMNREFSTGIEKAISKASASPVNSDKYNEFLLSAAAGNAAQLRPVLDGLRDTLVGL